MGLTGIWGIGILLVMIVLIRKNTLMRRIDGGHWAVRKMMEQNWIHNQWVSGLFLFVLNMVIFGAFIFLFFVSGWLMIPYIHLVIMLGATILSIYLWMAVRVSCRFEKRKQVITGFIGSGFYLMLFIVLFYQFWTLDPGTPEQDTFMAAIGLMFGMVASAVAWLVCFLITGMPGNGRDRVANK